MGKVVCFGDSRQDLHPTPKAMTYTTTYGNPAFFAPADRVTVAITSEERDAINAANAALYCTTYDGDLFADMFGA
jgi:hypothetical protein